LFKEEWDYGKFKSRFYSKTGLDLESYKDQQMERRIRHMMQREKCDDFHELFIRLSNDADFMHRFMHYITINTSGFFRDAVVFDRIKNNVLDELKQKHAKLRFWSVGCANGEEPYTLSIILDELKLLSRSHIMASDFDTRALEYARVGAYNERQVDSVPKNLLQKCFAYRDGNYVIDDRYRRKIRFFQENILELRTGNKKPLHLILCRNVFIYFKTAVQERIIHYFSDLLDEGSYLVIGCAEYINDPRTFGLQRKYPAIYRKSF